MLLLVKPSPIPEKQFPALSCNIFPEAHYLRFAVSHSLSDRFSLGYNLGALWEGESAVPAGYYSLALGIGITDYLGAFVESYGLLSEDMEHYIDFGFTGLVLPNFQLDVSGGFGINQNAADMLISAGLSYRIPR